MISSGINKDSALREHEKIIDICQKFHADAYINAIGGRKLYDKKSFHAKGIDLYFLKTGSIVYYQFFGEFIPNLSIIDVMMFNSRADIKQMLALYSLVKE